MALSVHRAAYVKSRVEEEKSQVEEIKQVMSLGRLLKLACNLLYLQVENKNRTDGWTDGRTDGRRDGRTDGRTDGWTIN